MRYTDLLEAERPYALYHGTSTDYFAGIWSADSVRGDYGSDSHHQGVSLSSSIDVAAGFAENSEMQFREHLMSEGIHELTIKSRGCILVFDSADLRASFGIKRVRDGGPEEKEMRTIGHLSQVRSHLKAVIADRDHLEAYLAIAVEPQPDQEYHVMAPDFSPAIRWLLSSPLLRPFPE